MLYIDHSVGHSVLHTRQQDRRDACTKKPWLKALAVIPGKAPTGSARGVWSLGEVAILESARNGSRRLPFQASIGVRPHAESRDLERCKICKKGLRRCIP